MRKCHQLALLELTSRATGRQAISLAYRKLVVERTLAMLRIEAVPGTVAMDMLAAHIASADQGSQDSC